MARSSSTCPSSPSTSVASAGVAAGRLGFGVVGRPSRARRGEEVLRRLPIGRRAAGRTRSRCRARRGSGRARSRCATPAPGSRPRPPPRWGRCRSGGFRAASRGPGRGRCWRRVRATRGWPGGGRLGRRRARSAEPVGPPGRDAHVLGGVVDLVRDGGGEVACHAPPQRGGGVLVGQRPGARRRCAAAGGRRRRCGRWRRAARRAAG